MSTYELVFTRGAQREYASLDGSVRSMVDKGVGPSARPARRNREAALRSACLVPGTEVSCRWSAIDLPHPQRSGADS